MLRDRVVPLVGQAGEALKAYLAVRDGSVEYDNVFLARNGTSMDVRTVRYRIQKYYLEAGIRKKASVHTLRHTFATRMADAGMEMQELAKILGHTDISMTYRYYHLTKKVNDKMRDILNKRAAM